MGVTAPDGSSTTHSPPPPAGGDGLTPAPVGVRCPTCGEAIVDGENFCEACGTQLVTTVVPPDGLVAPRSDGIVRSPSGVAKRSTTAAITMSGIEVVGPCRSCGSTESTDGWCDVCGSRMPILRDHFTEAPSSWVAGVCDRGVRHLRNEDAMALIADERAGSFAALVVCDGVSSTPDSDLAALDAARAAAATLSTLGADLRNSPPGTPAFVIQTVCQALVDAGAAGHAAATAVAKRAGVPDNPPSCTFVAAVIVDDVVAAGWAGDSRVYWLPDGGPGLQLSVDDSWATQQVLAGVAREVAEADPQAHAITKWLGADSADSTISCASLSTDNRAGWVLACSDGLWNYVSEADELAVLIAGMIDDESGGDPLAREQQFVPARIAQLLVDFANRQGGHDNITVAVARIATTPTTLPNA